MTGKSVLIHVGESRHHTAAQATTKDTHVTGPRPHASYYVVALNLTGGAEAIVAPNNKELIIDHFNAKVATGGHHGGHCMPSVSPRVVGLNATQKGVTIKTTNL